MRLRLVVAVPVILAACVATSANQPTDTATRSSKTHVFADRIARTGLPNFAQVTPRLYRGGQPREPGYQELKKMGIDIVVDLRLTGKDREKQDVTSVGMQYVSIPWHCYFPRDDVIAQFLDLLRRNPAKKVFVHCRYGDDRTGMMIASYRMAVEGWTPEEARKEMQQFGFHRLLCPSLGPYEKDFPEHLKKNPELQNFRSIPGENTAR